MKGTAARTRHEKPFHLTAIGSGWPVSSMMTGAIDGMMIPNPRLSMNTDNSTKTRAARDVVKRRSGKSGGRALSGICPVPC
jgi:hypothetical protein